MGGKFHKFCLVCGCTFDKERILYYKSLNMLISPELVQVTAVFILTPGLRLQEEVYLCSDNLPLTGLVPWFCHCECGCGRFLLSESSHHGHQQCRGLQVAGTVSSSLRRFHNEAKVFLLMNLLRRPQDSGKYIDFSHEWGAYFQKHVCPLFDMNLIGIRQNWKIKRCMEKSRNCLTDSVWTNWHLITVVVPST